MTKKVLITGVGGFIGHHLARKIIETTDWEIVGIDLNDNRVISLLTNPRFTFVKGDIRQHYDWISEQVQNCDTIIPLVAIATPATYVQSPVKVFELDFQANLSIVQDAVRFNKHLIWPSTSEVYGMNTDSTTDPYSSNLVYGPITKSRWIYACAKQMMDRLIVGYGQEQNLKYTIFRPFNWIGTGLDELDSDKPRVVTQFLANIINGKDLELVDGGQQRRCFTDISDGVNALMKIIENTVAVGKIYNIGNPKNDYSVAQLADMMLAMHNPHCVSKTTTTGEKFYGDGYQDMSSRTPDIKNTISELNWNPDVDMQESIQTIINFYINRNQSTSY